jgi:putative ABC transport system permease protein
MRANGGTPAHGVALRLLGALLPHGERAEVVADVAAEHAARRARDGRVRAFRWLWWQVLASVPSLVRHGVWRGRTGFEPDANRFRSGGPMYESWIMDARFALRRLVKHPTYTLLAVLTLALGVGGTAAIFGIARTLLISPLPIAAEQEVMVWWMERSWSEAELQHLRGAGVPGFSAIAAYGVEDVRVSGDGATQVITAVRTSAELFDVLGVRPRLGPGFEAGDDAVGAEPKVVLSHGMWRDLGGDPSIIGQRVELDGVARTVAGVMPPDFWFPDPHARAWLTHGFDPANRAGWYTIVGRLLPGQTQGEIGGALSAIATSLGETFQYPPAWDPTVAPALTPVREHVLSSARPTLLATLAAMAVILLIACANVAALMLGQTETRSTELSVRSALGAGRARLTQQLLAEGVVLGLAAGVAGAVFAALTFSVLLAALPLGALAERAALDWGVFWFALVLALAAALAIAMIPVLSLLRAELRGALSSGRSGGIAGRGGRVESGLVVSQVALAVLIAAGAALLLRSVANLRAIETGIRADGVAVLDIVAPAELAAAERTRVVRELVAELGTLPGVQHAAATQKLPLRGSGHNWGLAIEGRPDVTGVTTAFRVVTHDYFAVLGTRLRAGRLFEAGDRAETERVAVINASLAARYFPGEDPVGRRLHEFGGFARIIGVIDDMREAGLTDEGVPARYLLYDQVPYSQPANTLVLRTAARLDPLAVIDAARQTIRRTAPSVGIQEATTMQRVVERAMGPARQMTALLGLLAALALLLGGIGVYGVVSHFVHRRRRDWGIRMALGLRPARVLGQVVGRGSALVAGGIALGIGGALLVTRVLASFVYGIGTTDPAALAAAAATLFVIGVLGALFPARRASRVDPARVLREQ